MPDIAKVILEYELKSEKWRVRGKGRRAEESHRGGRGTMIGFSVV